MNAKSQRTLLDNMYSIGVRSYSCLVRAKRKGDNVECYSCTLLLRSRQIWDRLWFQRGGVHLENGSRSAIATTWLFRGQACAVITALGPGRLMVIIDEEVMSYPKDYHLDEAQVVCVCVGGGGGACELCWPREQCLMERQNKCSPLGIQVGGFAWC
jgi:hypothetical protein